MTTQRGVNGVPTYRDVFRTPRYLPIFGVSTLSQWGDFIATITIAAVVYERTGSPLATATTIAVSLVPKAFGRALLGPVVDRLPYRDVLVASHVLRALAVVLLIALVTVSAPLPAIFLVLFLIESVGGVATSAAMLLLTDLFTDRRIYAKAMGLAGMTQQLNQALGLAVGGVLVAVLGARTGLVVDLVTFVVAAVVMALVVERRPVVAEPQPGIVGFGRDLVAGVGSLARNRVLAHLVLLSMVAGLAISAPEALAIPLAGNSRWGGVLMAAPIVGAFVGIVLISRRDVYRQNALMLPLALAMSVPLLATALPLPLWVVWTLWFVSGMFQAFMIPLQATFTLATEPAMRGRVFSLAGSLSVLSGASFFVVAGWIAQLTSPAMGVAICAAVCLGAVGLVALKWPHGEVQQSVDRAFGPSPAAVSTAMATPPPVEPASGTPSRPAAEPAAAVGAEPTRDAS